ncbi:MAG: hypothetical protein CMJ80_12385 [Planctomycetaceae bacterium]|nr:hypothetical protein [Planctomycetaceae bacterium]
MSKIIFHNTEIDFDRQRQELESCGMGGSTATKILPSCVVIQSVAVFYQTHGNFARVRLSDW